ncbi:MAG: hypothetical protein MUF38_13350 [Anaerolineae bacterium]|jgi:hypothetical protein|nr:hypothetical protein [Anaerolineae bacterium]
MSTVNFQLVALGVMGFFLLISSVRGIKNKSITFGVAGGRSGGIKPLLTVFLTGLPAQIVSFHFLLAGFLFFIPVIFLIFNISYDKYSMIRIVGIIAIVEILMGLSIGIVLQIMINIGQILKKTDIHC